MPPRTAAAAAPTRSRGGGGAAPASTGTRRLVIVESPAKARTIARFLGDGYVVESSIGHIRDLPRNAADVPASHKGQPWARLGVDTEHNFEPLYVVSPDKKAQVSKLKSLLKDADELLLATDEDREGEAIAWHLLDVLKPRVPVRRMVFHEITPTAIQHAVDNPRELDRRLVDAQETRRILDRLYGYEVSPVLWKKVMPRLSAGRVQSVATRILVERERARMKFRSAGYWDLEGHFEATASNGAGPTAVVADLVALDGKKVATGRDFSPDATLTPAAQTAGVVVVDQGRAAALAAALEGTAATVRSLEERPYRRSPAAPFMTSTLQQEAGRKLRFGSQRAMQVAQRLYENGHITYMRTDSTTLSETALSAARSQARALYGDAYVPDKPRTYAKKVKNAQEAHEAIRPAGDTFRTPGEMSGTITGDELRLYELIWQRTVSSQMADATGTSATLRVAATATSGEDCEFSATGTVITFPGFLRAYEEGEDEAGEGKRDRQLPPVAQGDALATREVLAQSHVTSPPARYTEASLVKALEERGIGRPSTYASIIGTVQDRGYVFKKGTALVPSFTAFAVVGLLESHFGRLVDYGFTASMEDDLDAIAGGVEDSKAWLTRFYFGAHRDKDGVALDGHEGGLAQSGGLKALVAERLGDIDAREVNSIPIGNDAEGRALVVRVGRFGPYVQRGDGEDSLRASLPEDMAADELTPERATELLEAPSGDRVLGTDPDTGRDVVARSGRYGPYVSLAAEEGESGPPKSSSLFAGMDLDTLTFEQALRLLTLPRLLGRAEDGEEITAQNGRYGPYVKKGTDSRSIPSEDELFTVDLAGALALFAQPKARGRRAAAAPPLRTLGPDPESKEEVTVKEGRFGPYVTDGTTNASLRKGDVVESITIERAAELLADRRARGPAPKKAAAPRKPAAKKPAAKKPAAKKPATT